MLNDPRGIAALAELALVAEGFGGVHVLDASDSSQLTEWTSFNTAGKAQNVAMVENTVYVADGIGGLVLLRLTRNSIYLPLLRRS